MSFNADAIDAQVRAREAQREKSRQADADRLKIDQEGELLFSAFPELKDSYDRFMSRCVKVGEIDHTVSVEASSSVNTKVLQLIESSQRLSETLQELKDEDSQFRTSGAATKFFDSNADQISKGMECIPNDDLYSDDIPQQLVKQVYATRDFIDIAAVELGDPDDPPEE